MIASIYLDINLPVVPDWFRRLVDFGKGKSYGFILGLDTNAHSLLYGPDSNSRGEDLESFIISEGLRVENLGTEPTFRVRRGNVNIATHIDVTLTFGLEFDIMNWCTKQEFNGSDHATIMFDTQRAANTLSLIHI